RFCRKVYGAKEIVAQSVRELGQCVGTGWRYDYHIGGQGEMHVVVPLAGAGLEVVDQYGVTRKGGQRQWRDKADGVGGHHHLYLSASFDQQAGQVGRFVRGNAATYAQQDVLSPEVHYSSFSLSGFLK